MRLGRIALVLVLFVLPMLVAQLSLGCRGKAPPPVRKVPDDGRVDGYIRWVNPSLAAPQTNRGTVQFVENLDAWRAPQDIQFLQRELRSIEEILGLQLWQYQYSFPSNAVVEMTFRFKNGARNHFTFKSLNRWRKIYPPAPGEKSEGNFLLFRYRPNSESGFVLQEKYLKHWYQGNTNNNPRLAIIPSTYSRWGLYWFDLKGTRTETSAASGEELPWNIFPETQTVKAESLLRPEWGKENVLFDYEMTGVKTSETNAPVVVKISIFCKVTRLEGTTNFGKKEGGYIRDDSEEKLEQSAKEMWKSTGPLLATNEQVLVYVVDGKRYSGTNSMPSIFPDIIDVHSVDYEKAPRINNPRVETNFFEDFYLKRYDPSVKLDDMNIVHRRFTLPAKNMADAEDVTVFFNKRLNLHVIERGGVTVPYGMQYYGPFEGTPAEKLVAQPQPQVPKSSP